MDFTFYQGTRTPANGQQITLRRSGQLVLTPATVALFDDDTTHVQLGYDPKAGVVGLRPALEGGKGRYRLRRQTNGSSLVDGRRFVTHHELTLDKAQAFEAEVFGDGIVGFRLPEGDAAAPDQPVARTTKTARTGKRQSAAA